LTVAIGPAYAQFGIDARIANFNLIVPIKARGTYCQPISLSISVLKEYGKVLPVAVEHIRLFLQRMTLSIECRWAKHTSGIAEILSGMWI